LSYDSPLDSLANHDCELCPLHETTDRVCVMGKGDPQSRIMLVGEAPGAQEERSGKVFSGPAGQLLDKCLERAGLSPSELYITNAVKCRPPENRKPERWEGKICAETYLTAEIKEIQPSHILLLGNEALTAVAKKSGITKHRGVRLEVKGHPKSRTIMAAFHPAYALRNPGVHPTLQEDIRRFARAIKGEFQVVPVQKKYVHTVRGLKRVIELLRSAPSGTVVSYDVENRYRPWDSDWSIQCIGVSVDGKTSYVIPLYHPESPFVKKWQSVLLHLREVLTRPDLKLVGQNAKHDNAKQTRKYLLKRKKFIFHPWPGPAHPIAGESQINRLTTDVRQYSDVKCGCQRLLISMLRPERAEPERLTDPKSIQGIRGEQDPCT